MRETLAIRMRCQFLIGMVRLPITEVRRIAWKSVSIPYRYGTTQKHLRDLYQHSQVSIPYRYGTTCIANNIVLAQVASCQFLIGMVRPLSCDTTTSWFAECQFLIGMVRLPSTGRTPGECSWCQFLIGMVRHVLIFFRITQTIKCQFLIGMVRPGEKRRKL